MRLHRYHSVAIHSTVSTGTQRELRPSFEEIMRKSVDLAYLYNFEIHMSRSVSEKGAKP